MTNSDLLKIAVNIAKKSNDPRTHVGAFVYSLENGLVRGEAANEFSKGFSRCDLVDNSKYDIIIHAEQLAVMRGRRKRLRHPLALVATAACCVNCAKIIAASDVEVVITSKKALEAMPKWQEEIEQGHKILERAGVELKFAEAKRKILIGGEKVVI